jgi:hypothetical protein
MRGGNTSTRFGARAIFCIALIYIVAFHAFFFGFVSARMASAEASGLPVPIMCQAGGVAQSPQPAPGDETPSLPDCCKHHHCILCAGGLLPSPQSAGAAAVSVQPRFSCLRLRVSWPLADPPLREVGRSESRSPRAPPVCA